MNQLMKVFKFGGASLKSAEAVHNMANILRKFPKDRIIVIVSAMGKTTNALEQLTEAYYYKKANVNVLLNEIKKYHLDIAGQLFTKKDHPVFDELNNTFVELDWAVEGEPAYSYNLEYDQIVSMGEIISSKIVSAYLNEIGIGNTWLDVRDLIKTDDTFREAKVNWEQTENAVRKNINPVFSENKTGAIILTQGFLGGTTENFTSTLGREGSDYTAAILAFTASADEVTIWKDVPGVLNADPKWFDETKKIEQLSYQDAIELAYYGATVIHPKTIKPLQNKKIPLYVKSFLSPDDRGTLINEIQSPLPTPCFIFKINQVLISISPKDFSFIVEENLSDIFKLFAGHDIKINMIQNSAISLSVSADGDERQLTSLIEILRKDFRVLYNENLELITIRYYDQETINRVIVNKKILLEQKSRYTVQLVVRNI